MNHDDLNNLGRCFIKETILLSFIEINPVVCDKKILKVFYIDI